MIVPASFWWLWIQSDTFDRAPVPVDIQLLTVGSRLFPNSSVTLCICCFNTVNFCDSVLLIAAAISVATPVPDPITSYRSRIPVCRSPVLLYNRSMTATASSEPNASLISFFSIASMVSPYLVCKIPRISGILFSCLFASRNDKPSLSPALTAVFSSALYLVAASDPDMVACIMPKMASCSSSGTFALVAVAPRVDILCAICDPLVL